MATKVELGGSQYFDLAQFTRSDKATAKKINNDPSAEHQKHLDELVSKILHPFRVFLDKPIIVTSGYRSPALNAAIPRSSKTSAHSHGYAADIKCPGYEKGDVRKLAIALRDWLKANDIKYDQLIYEFSGGAKWVHIGIRNGEHKQRGEVLTYYRKVYSKGIMNV